MTSRRLALSPLLLFLPACGDDAPSGPDAAPDAREGCEFRTAADDVTPPPIHTPRWAFRPWISKDISDDADTRAFVEGFQSRDIPVGAVVLDSPWETHYNTFVPNPSRYPDFDQLVEDLHADDIKIVLWVTQMVNSSGIDLESGGDDYDGPSPNFQEGLDCGFYVDDGAEYLWWKGTGAGLDFSDPQAVGWWHRQQDPLYELGIDGWKLDFGEDYLQGPPFRTDAGEQSLQDYSEAYYADFYAYGASRRDELVTMVRPYDKSYEFPGRFYARPEHAPVAWVGDNRRDWVGLADALDHLFRSADAGYVAIGSDVGGYLDRDDQDFSVLVPFDTLVFARWTAVGALTPFMQLHGRANITPWTVPDSVDETVALYRYWSTLHDQLVPLWYSLAEEAYAGGEVIMRPIGDGPAQWEGDYRWMVGDALLVAPLLDETGVRDVPLPAGTWFEWWSPGGDAIAGGVTLPGVALSKDRSKIPLYVKEGAIIPAEVNNDVTDLGSEASAGALTLAIWPAATETSFTVHHARGVTSEVRALRGGATALRVELDDFTGAVVLRVRLDTQPALVNRGGAILSVAASRDEALASTGEAWFYEPGGKWLWVKLSDASGDPVITTTP